jgi:hypothetical protein
MVADMGIPWDQVFGNIHRSSEARRSDDIRRFFEFGPRKGDWKAIVTSAAPKAIEGSRDAEASKRILAVSTKGKPCRPISYFLRSLLGQSL